MRAFRKDRNCTEHYTSFEAAAAGWNVKPVKKRTSDSEKLKIQREKFLGTCKCCGQPLHYVSGTNVIVCNNKTCNGFKHSEKNIETGEEKVWYIPVTRTLDEKGFNIAMNLFD